MEEAFEIHGRLGDPISQAQCLVDLARLLNNDNKPDAAEEAVSRAINLPEEGQQLRVCKCHRALGETEKAIHHYEVALGTGSLLNKDDLLF